MTTTWKYNVIVDKLNRKNMRYLKLSYDNKLPNIVDLRSKMSDLYVIETEAPTDVSAICAALEYNNNKLRISKPFIWNNEKIMKNNFEEEIYTTLGESIDAIKKYGSCVNELYPCNKDNYDINPTSHCYRSALDHFGIKVRYIKQNLEEMRKALALGYVFVVVIQVYSSFESADALRTGVVSLPDFGNDQYLGGYATVCVGYNNLTRMWIMRHAENISIGDAGYFYLPYEYLLNSSLAGDLWNITSITEYEN